MANNSQANNTKQNKNNFYNKDALLEQAKKIRNIGLKLDETERKLIDMEFKNQKQAADDNTELQSQITQNAQSITSLQESAQVNENNIRKNFTMISENINDIAVNSDAIETLETRVDNLEDTLEEMTGGIAEVTASDVNSQSATSGQVLTANGNGGASWQTVSAGLSTVQDGNIDSETATQGQVLTADGNGGASWENANASGGMTQEQETKLNQAYNYYLTHVVEPDPYYAPQTFSDYPAGTILQGYAKFRRKMYKTETATTFSLPLIAFSAENNSAGSANVKVCFTASKSFSGIFEIYQNETVIFQENITFNSSDLSFIIEREVNGLTLSSGNVFLIKIAISSKVSITFTLLQMDLIAPNAEVVNQISPFAVDYFDGKYYVSDCSSGTAKIAEINVNDIFNINSLTWADTGIECLQYKSSFSYALYGEQYVPDKRFDYYYALDGKTIFINKNTNATVNNPYVGLVDWSRLLIQGDIRYAGIRYDNTAAIYVYGGGNSISYNNRETGKYFNTSAAKYLQDENYAVLKTFSVLSKSDGILTAQRLSETSANNLTLGFGSNFHAYIESMSGKVIYMSCYSKYYDKIIKRNYQFNSNTGVFTLLSTEEIGAYEEYFEGVNNDYFVVKNGKLEYHKKLT